MGFSTVREYCTLVREFQNVEAQTLYGIIYSVGGVVSGVRDSLTVLQGCSTGVRSCKAPKPRSPDQTWAR